MRRPPPGLQSQCEGLTTEEVRPFLMDTQNPSVRPHAQTRPTGDPRTGEGAVLSDIHSTPSGPRYATRKDFVYGEDVTIGDWTISTEDLPRYQSGAGEHPGR